MAQNYIRRGEVITLIAPHSCQSGEPYRLNGFNGVALISVQAEEQLSFQLEGIFEFVLSGVEIGQLIYIDNENRIGIEQQGEACEPLVVFGRAVTSSDSANKFCCRILQRDW